MVRHSSPLSQASLSSLTVAESRSALNWEENKPVGCPCLLCRVVCPPEALPVIDQPFSLGLDIEACVVK